MPRPGAAGREANWQAGFGAPLPAAPGTPSPASWGGIGLPRAVRLMSALHSVLPGRVHGGPRGVRGTRGYNVFVRRGGKGANCQDFSVS